MTLHAAIAIAAMTCAAACEKEAARPAPAPAPAMAAPKRASTGRRDHIPEYAEMMPRHGVMSVAMGLAGTGPEVDNYIFDADASTLALYDMSRAAVGKRALSPAERDRLRALGAAASAAIPDPPHDATDYREIFVVADGDDVFVLDRNAPITGAAGAVRTAMNELLPLPSASSAK